MVSVKYYDVCIPKALNVYYDDEEDDMWKWDSSRFNVINKKFVEVLKMQEDLAKEVFSFINNKETLLPILAVSTSFDTIADIFYELSSSSNNTSKESNAKSIMKFIEKSKITDFNNPAIRIAILKLYNIAEVAEEFGLPIVVIVEEKEEPDPVPFDI